jgi:2-succinyl-5-enolpyruvyl-6-hydroxy-3-cyclohexene-1-carboxylate synthase
MRMRWAGWWARLGGVARSAIRRWLQDLEEPFEGKVFAALSELLPDGSTLYAGNSMPVRDLDTFFEGTARNVRVLGNRGASGIDGLVSSGLGAAAAAGQVQPARVGPTVLVLGDLALYHDLNGLLAAKRHQLPATIILLNNDGGGIFSFLPQASYPHFEELFGTPTGLDFGAAVEAYGATFVRAQTWAGFRRAVQASFERAGVSVVEMRTARDRNVALHQETWKAVAAAVGAELRHAPGAEG